MPTITENGMTYETIDLGNGRNEKRLVDTTKPRAVLVINMPAVATAGQPVTFTITVEDDQGSPLPITSTYYAGISRVVDGYQGAFAKIDLVNGTATVTATINEPGIYEVRPDNIEPPPEVDEISAGRMVVS